MSSATQNHNEKPKPIEDYLKKADVLLDKRFLHFGFNCLGKKAEVQLENGKKVQGTFYTANIDIGGVVLKNCSEVDDKENPVPTKVLPRHDFVYLLVPNVEEPPLLNAKKDVFKTDAEISKKKTVGQRKLVKWSADEQVSGETLGMALEDLPEKGKWNQFELNQKKFGLTSDFEEGMYTTQIDMKNVSSALLEKAARIEAEILGATSDFDNRHIREERGLQALREENENEEDIYSSVIRTDAKGADKRPEEKRVFGFTNSKRKTNDQPTTSTTPAASENKKDTKETTETTGTSKTSLTIPIHEADTSSARAKANENYGKSGEGEKTPQGDSDRQLNRQTSNISEDASSSNKHKARLSLKANSFEAPPDGKPKEEAKTKEEVKAKEEPKPKEEEKPKPPIAKQASLDVEPEKKFNINDYSSTAITKFKLKITDKDIKRSSCPFFEIAISNWQKKPAIPDPATVNPSWKIAKVTAPITVTPIVPAKTPVASTTTTTASKTFKPNPAPYQGGIPNYARTDNPNMMFTPPFVPQGFVPNAPMGYMPYGMPQQKFQPGVFPYAQPGFQPPFPSYVDPNQPSFNMNYQHNTGNNPNPNSRQGSMKNFNKNKS